MSLCQGCRNHAVSAVIPITVDLRMIGKCKHDTVMLTLGEFETIRLKDYQGKAKAAGITLYGGNTGSADEAVKAFIDSMHRTQTRHAIITGIVKVTLSGIITAVNNDEDNNTCREYFRKRKFYRGARAKHLYRD